MTKKIVLFATIWCILFNLMGTSYALSPPNIENVEISGKRTIKMNVGDTITLEATAIPSGVDYAYMTWVTDVDGIVELNGEYDKKLSPPVGTVDITALNAGEVEVIVCANLEAYPPELDIDEWSDATDRITITVVENVTFPEKYEVWNNGEYTGISSLLEYNVSNIDSDLYINIKDISKLGLNVEDIEGGIIVSNDVKKAKVMFDAEVLNLDSYSFETPVISTPKEHFLFLDIIGKCFSEGYSGSRVDDVWRIYLTVGSDSGYNKPPSISVQSMVFNFDYNVYTIQLKNTSYSGADIVNIYNAYYSKDGVLLDLKTSKIYNLKAKDELTIFMPISDFLNSSAKCKIMLWNDKMQPIGEGVTIKDFVYDKNITVPENKEIIFNDIHGNHKYYDAIYIMHNQNIGWFNGYEDGTYKPDEYMLKSEFAYSLVAMLGIQVRNIKVDCNLKDVPSSHWCKNAIGFLVSNNIMDAENEYFYPNNEITLNEVLTVFLRILGEKNITTDTIFMLANQHNLLTNVNTGEVEITRGNYTQIAYNFMKEYCE